MVELGQLIADEEMPVGPVRPGELRGAEPFQRVCSLCRAKKKMLLGFCVFFFFETLGLRRDLLL